MLEGEDQGALRRGSTAGADCAACPFAKDGQPRAPVTSELPAEDDPAWIVIGEGPGNFEVVQGRPWVGPSGQIVNRALKTVKRDRRSLMLANITACKPTQGSDDKARHRAAACCAPRLRRELAELPAVPVLALGAVAARALLPTKLKGITQLTGTWHREDVDGTGRLRDVIPTIHPAAILRGGGEVKGAHTSELGYWPFLFDVAKVEALATGRARALPIECIRVEVDDGARADQLIGEIYVRALKEGAVALDLETFVDDPDRHDARQTFAARIDTLGLSTLDYAIAVRYQLLGRGARNLLAAILRNPKIAIVAQNGILYDRAVLTNEHHRYVCHENWHDTMLMHHAVFPGMPHNLQTIATQFFLVSPWKSEYRERERSADEDTPEARATYCAKDTLSTRLIKPALEVWIKRKEVDRVYEQDRAIAFVAAQISRRGMPIDREVNRELDHVMSAVVEETEATLRAGIAEQRDEFWDKLSVLQAATRRKDDPAEFRARAEVRLSELVKTAGKKGWQYNPHANLQCAAMLQLAGASLTKRSKKGAISTDAEVMEKFSHLPLVKDQIRWGENEKILGTFIRPMFDHEVDGEIHHGFAQWRGDHHRIFPSISVHKITARWGSDHPGTGNWSKGDKVLCPDCRARLIVVAFDAYFHEDNPAKPCARGGTCLPRSAVIMTGSKIPNLRQQVRARRGWKLVGFDFGQQESRALGYLSDDPWLCSVFEAGKDIHSEFAAVVWEDYWICDPVIRGKRRDNIKNAEFGAFYKGSEETVWKTLRINFPTIELRDVRRMLTLMTEKLGRLHQWQAEMLAALGRPPHEIRDPMLGRLRCFPLAMFTPQESANWIIQHFGAWLMCQGLLRMRPRIEKYGDHAFWIGQFHDAAVFEVREDLADRVADDCTKSFAVDLTTASGRTVPFPVDVKIADTWALV